MPRQTKQEILLLLAILINDLIAISHHQAQHHRVCTAARSKFRLISTGADKERYKCRPRVDAVLTFAGLIGSRCDSSGFMRSRYGRSTTHQLEKHCFQKPAPCCSCSELGGGSASKAFSCKMLIGIFINVTHICYNMLTIS